MKQTAFIYAPSYMLTSDAIISYHIHEWR